MWWRYRQCLRLLRLLLMKKLLSHFLELNLPRTFLTRNVGRVPDWDCKPRPAEFDVHYKPHPVAHPLVSRCRLWLRFLLQEKRANQSRHQHLHRYGPQLVPNRPSETGLVHFLHPVQAQLHESVVNHIPDFPQRQS